MSSFLNQNSLHFKTKCVLFARLLKDLYQVNSLLIYCCLFLYTLPAHSEIYSWKDKNGTMHYSDKKINGLEQKKLKLTLADPKNKNFTIKILDIDKVLSVKEKKQINKDVTAVYRFFDQFLIFAINKTIQIKIRIYKTQTDYKNYLAKNYHSKSPHTRGIYFANTNEIIAYVNPVERWRTFWTIKHEASHAIIQSLAPNTPAWLNEGLSENLESLTYQNKKLILEPHYENHHSAKSVNPGNEAFQVSQFLSMKSKLFYKNMQASNGTNQIYSGELVRMLLSNTTGKNFIAHLIKIYKNGRRTYSAPLAEKYYHGGLSVMQTDWNNWSKRATSQRIML